MMKEIIILIGLIIIAIGVITIYDARRISEKFFSSDDTNKNIRVLKTVGLVVVCITLGIIYMC